MFSISGGNAKVKGDGEKYILNTQKYVFHILLILSSPHLTPPTHTPAVPDNYAQLPTIRNLSGL